MSVLSESLSRCTVEGNILSLPPITDTPIENYPELKRALIKAGAKYKKNTFIFPSSAQPIVDRLMDGESINLKKQFQFFETPDALADRLITLAEIHHEDWVCEPSAGQGAIVKACHRAHGEHLMVWGYELMPENRRILNNIKGFRLAGEDFLQEERSFYDVFIANPPFSKNQDIDHIYHMYKLLESGGRLVSVASTHWQQVNNRKEVNFRAWLKVMNAEIEEIPSGTFKESGTMVKSCIIKITKPV